MCGTCVKKKSMSVRLCIEPVFAHDGKTVYFDFLCVRCTVYARDCPGCLKPLLVPLRPQDSVSPDWTEEEMYERMCNRCLDIAPASPFGCDCLDVTFEELCRIGKLHHCYGCRRENLEPEAFEAQCQACDSVVCRDCVRAGSA